MKFFITKYCLTEGIQEIDGEYCDGHELKKDMIEQTINGRITYTYYHKRDFFETPEEAKIQAEKIKQKKIKSLEKNLDKLRNLKFI